MRRVLRWTKRIVVGLVALIVIGVGILILALHTDWGRNRVRERVVEQLGLGARVERIEGSVFGTLVVHGVSLPAKDGKPFVEIKTVRVKLALLPLLGKTARIDEIVADEVSVHVRPQPPEPAKPPEPRPAANEPSTWSVEMPAVRVKSAHVEIATASGSELIEGLDANVSLSMPAGKPLNVSVAATARWRGQDVSVVAELTKDDVVRVPFATIGLGGARAIATNIQITDVPTVDGSFVATVPAALVRSLAHVDVPGDIALVAHSANGAVDVHGTAAGNQLDIFADTDLANMHARAIVGAQIPDLAAISHGKVTGHGTVVVTLTADADHAVGLVSVTGVADEHAGSALVAIDATRDRAGAIVLAKGDRDPFVATWRLGGSIDVARVGERWSISRSQLVADATRLRHAGLRVQRIHARLTATGDVEFPSGMVDLQLAGIRRGELVIPSATLAAHATRQPDGVLAIDVDRHVVRAADGTIWSGPRGAHITVADDRIVVTDLRTGTGTSRLTASVSITPSTGHLAAKLTARDVSLALVDPTLTGQIAADVDITRTAGMWSGSANVDAKQVTLPKRPPIDGTLALHVDKRRITAHGTATNAKIGGATFDVEVIGPADITDPMAWQRVDRSSIKRMRIALQKIDASQLGASGRVDGDVAIGANDTGGGVTVRGVQTSAGSLDSELVIRRNQDGDLAAHGKAQLAGLDPVGVDATIALPLHPFDPRAWQQLGRAALKGATIEADHIAFDPQLLARFGVKASVRGTLATKITIGPGARTTDIALDIHQLTAPELNKPVDIHLSGGADGTGMHVDVNALTDRVSVAVTAKTPLTVDAAIAGGAPSAAIDATVTVPKIAARDVAQLLGRNDVLGGTLGGTVTIGGTANRLTGRAQIAIDNLAIAAGIAKKPPTLEKLELDARWYGDYGELELTGFEAGGRMLKISARGRPDSLPTLLATIEAGNFDLAPLAAFAPGQLAGARGIVGGVLRIKGFDPQTGEVKGKLHISEGRMPLSATLGTLRSADVDVTVRKQEIVANLSGKLGSGTVKGQGTVRLTMGAPTAAELTIALRKISPIGTVQPVISADISGWFARTKSRWTGKLTVKNGNVYVPPEGGHELLGLGTPGDIIFVDAKIPPPKPAHRAPQQLWLTADVTVGRTKIEVEDRDFTFAGYASGRLALAVGDTGLGLDGTIATETGSVDVLGRRYHLDHGIVGFDGTLDPHVDIELVHDFKELTLTADIGGRASNPDLRLSGDPGTYTQGQLLGILAGGDPGEGGQGAVVGGGLAVFSSRLGKKLTKRLPIKLDTISYEAETIESSRAIKVGTRFGEKTYLLWRQRFEARPDENPGEGVLEYQLPKNMLLESNVGERSKGVDLMWRWRR